MATLRIAFLSALVLELLATLGVALVAVGIGLRLVFGEMTLTTGLTVLLLAPDVYWPLRRIGVEFHAAQDGRTAADKAFALIGEPTVVEGQHPDGRRARRADPSRQSERRRPRRPRAARSDRGHRARLGDGADRTKRRRQEHHAAGDRRAHRARRRAGSPWPASTSPTWSRPAWWRSCPGCRSARCWCPAPSREPGAARRPRRPRKAPAPQPDSTRCWPSCLTGWTPCSGAAASGLSLGQRQRLGLARALGSPAAGAAARRAHRAPGRSAPRNGCCGPSSSGRAPVRPWSSSAIATGRGHRRPGHRSRRRAVGALCASLMTLRGAACARSDCCAAADLLRPRCPASWRPSRSGCSSLGSALALAGVSAWLITRAWQMPPVLDLSVAVVAVRTFAISRGVLHYCERLATHDTALRAAGTARAQIYHRLAHGPAAAAVRLHSGELVARVGADVDELADVLVRALVPIGVAAVLALAATAVVGAISPPAAVVLAICLLIAGVVAPLACRPGGGDAGRGCPAASFRARHVGHDRPRARARASGRRCCCPIVIAESQRRQRAWGDALDAAARPAAIAEAMPTAAIGASVLGAVVAGIGMAPRGRAHHPGGPDVVAAVGVRGDDCPCRPPPSS